MHRAERSAQWARRSTPWFRPSSLLLIGMVGLATGIAQSASHPTPATQNEVASIVGTPSSSSVIDALLAGQDARAAIADFAAQRQGTSPLRVLPARGSSAFAGYSGQLSRVQATLKLLHHDTDTKDTNAKTQQLARALDELSAQRLLVDARVEQIDHALAAPTVPAVARARWTEHRAPLIARLDRIAQAAQALKSTIAADTASSSVPQAVLAELSELLDAEAASASPAIYGASLPVFRPRLAPRDPAMSPAIDPTWADSTHANLPEPADLLGDDEAPLSAPILNQAKSLGYDYTRIFDFVRSQVRTEWYSGAQKGAEGTLRSLGGNDVDQASLLVALLRASGGPAHYVQSVVQIPVANLSLMLGVRDDRIGQALSAAGVANRPVAGGGHIASYALEQVVVSAYLPLSNYRGSAADFSGRTWVPLAPALKPVRFTPAQGALARAGIDLAAFLQQFLATPQSRSPLAQLRDDVTNALARLTPPVEYTSQLSRQILDAAPLELLPLSLPYPSLAVTGEFAQLPENLRQHAHVIVRAGSDVGSAVVLDHRMPISQLLDRRVTVSYAPASIDDGRIADLHGGLGGTPPHLVHLRAVLHVAGLPVAQGIGEIENATVHRVDIELDTPAGNARVSQQLTAGGLAALVFGVQQDGVAEMPAIVSGDSESKAARILANFGARYLSDWDAADDELARLLGVSVIRPFPAVALVINQYRVDRIGGVADSVTWQGVGLDAALRAVEPFAQGDNAVAESDWARLSSLQGSVLEHDLFEAQWRVDSISADKGLALARSRGAPVLNLTSATGTAELHQPAAVVENIAGWLARGYLVEVPSDPLTFEAWTGAVWRVTSPSTGESGYFIAGALAGGATAMPPAQWYFADLAELLANAYGQEPNEDPLSGAVLSLDQSAQGQIGIAAAELPQPLRAALTDSAGRPVVGGKVSFGLSSGKARLLDAQGQAVTEVMAVTDRNGVAAARVRLGEQQGSLGHFYIDDQHPYPQWIGLSEVEVRVTAATGTLYSGEPFSVFAWPAAASKLIFHGDAGRKLLPGMSYRAFTAEVTDAYDNAISNESITLGASTLYTTPSCAGSNPPHVDTVDASLFAPGQCPDDVLRLTGNACAQPSVNLMSRFGGAPFFVVPPATGLAQVDIQGSTDSVAQTLHLSTDDVLFNACGSSSVKAVVGWVHIPTHGQLPWFNDNLNPIIDAARPGELVPQSMRVDVLGADLTPGDHAGVVWHPIEHATFQAALQNGSLENVRELGNGTYLEDVRAGPDPGPIHGVIYAFFQNLQIALTAPTASPSPNTGEFDTVYAWSVDPRPPQVSPQRIALTAYGATDTPVVVAMKTEPVAYTASPVRMEWLENGEVQEEVGVPFADGNWYVNFSRGKRIDISKTYSVRSVINDGTPFVMRSEATPLNFSQGIFAGYGMVPHHNLNLPGQPPGDPVDLTPLLQGKFPGILEISESIDVPTGYVCPAPQRLVFRLNRAAHVSLAFSEHAASGGGAPPATVWQPLDNEWLDAGDHEVLVGPQDLALGDFPFELKAVADDGTAENLRGTAAHHAERHDSLALAHSLVKEVDVHNGNALLSEADIAIGGRGPGLHLTRSYSSHSGDQRGFFGRGWSADLDAQVLVDECDTRIVLGGAGQGQRFVSDRATADGGWAFKPIRGYHGTLVQYGGEYDFYAQDGLRSHFAELDLRGPRLSWIEDPNGNRVSYHYEFDRGQAHVTRISDASGRHIDLGYTVKDVTSQQNGIPIRESFTLVTDAIGPGNLHVGYAYDDAGNLTKVTRSDGTTGTRVQGYDYADLGYANQDPAGHSVNFHFGYRLTDARNLLDESRRHYTYSLGWSGVLVGDQQTEIQYIAEQRVATLTEPDNGLTRFDYHGVSGLGETTTDVTDARLSAVHYTLNRYGAIEKLDNGIDPPTLTVWDFDHLQRKQVTDALGTVTTFGYDDAGNRTDATIVHGADTLHRTWTFTPASEFMPPYIKDRVKTSVDGIGHSATFHYDGKGNRIESSRGGVTESDSYQPNGDHASHTDGRGKHWLYRYDAFGYLREAEDPLHHVSRVVADERGRALISTDALDATTTRTYDAQDRELTLTYPTTEAGTAVQTTVYDDRRHTQEVINPRHQSTLSTFDAMGRLRKVNHPDLGQQLWDYDANGNVILQTDFADHPMRMDYDAANRLTDRHEPEDRHTHFDNDALGHVLRETVSTETGADVRVTEFVYDHPLYLRTKVRKRLDSPGGAHWIEDSSEFDFAGNRRKQIDALQRETRYDYDERDRLHVQTEPLGKITTLEYDGADHKVEERLTNPSGSGEQVRQWIYDDAGQLSETVDATGARSQVGYDAVGNVTRLTDANQHRILRSWDTRHHQLTETGAELGQLTTYHYDLNGNRDGETWANGRVLTHTYDEMNRRTSTVDAIDIVEQATYDVDGNVKTHTDANGHVTTNHYDRMHRLVQQELPSIADQPRVALTDYNVHNEIIRQTDPGLHVTTTTYDTAGRKTATIVPAIDGQTDATGYDYDDAGNLLHETDARGKITTYVVNALNRRIGQTDPLDDLGIEHAQVWAYDEVGNGVSHTDRKGVITLTAYDAENREAGHVRDGLLLDVIHRDLVGNVDRLTDARAFVTTTEYDKANRKTVAHRKDTVGVDTVQRWTYTPLGDVASETSADQRTTLHTYTKRRYSETDTINGETTTYTVDGIGQRLSLQRPNAGGAADAWIYTFDVADRLATVTDPEQHTT
ncbi:MAG: DUF6531 domain-containing protein, partial [Tahibacter sp.]